LKCVTSHVLTCEKFKTNDAPWDILGMGVRTGARAVSPPLEIGTKNQKNSRKP